MQHVLCKVTANFRYHINWSRKSIMYQNIAENGNT